MPATIGPPNSAEIAENSPAPESTAEPRRPDRGDAAGRDADDRAEGHDRRLGAEHRAEGERAERGERDPGPWETGVGAVERPSSGS